MLGKIFSYSWNWIARPARAANDQLYDKQSAWIGFWVSFIFAALYSITSLLLWLTGFKPALPSVLPIPDESYYLWQTFFTVPWGIATWLITGGIIHLWNRIFMRKPKRGLGDILGPLGIAWVLPWFFFSWLPETVLAPILGPWQPGGFPPWPEVIELVRQTVPMVWMAILMYIAVRSVYEGKWLRTVTSVILGLAVFSVMFLMFIR